MQQAAPKTEHLSTANECNPLLVLESFGEAPVVLCMVSVWTRDVMTGCLEEKGQWVHSFWNAALLALPEAAGCRLGWNTVFLAVSGNSVEQIAKRLVNLLSLRQDSCLMSFCVLCEAAGEPRHKLEVLDVLGHEVGSEWSFGSSREYRPDGHRFYHLRDGKPYSIK